DRPLDRPAGRDRHQATVARDRTIARPTEQRGEPIMSQDQQNVDRLNDLGQTLRQQPSVRDAVLRRILDASAARSAAPSLMRRWWAVGGGAIAACLIIAITGINILIGDSASQAFAAAIDRVAKAHTFSCRQIIEVP